MLIIKLDLVIENVFRETIKQCQPCKYSICQSLKYVLINLHCCSKRCENYYRESEYIGAYYIFSGLFTSFVLIVLLHLS